MRTTVIQTAVAVVVMVAVIFSAAPQLPAQQPKEAEALLGFDPIELIGGQEKLGRSDLTAQHEGLTYLFVSEENRRLFLGDPQRYGVQMGGLCARLGRTTGGDQDLYTVYEGHIYVFAAPSCVDLFEAAPEKYLDPEPPAPLRETASPEELRRGRELIARAVEGLGGATAVDGLATLVERVTIVRTTAQGEVVAEQAAILDFAGRRFRRERQIGAGTLADAWVDGQGWWRSAGGAEVYSSAQAANLAREMVIANPAYILRMRGRDGFIAAAAGDPAAAGVAEVRVEVELEGDYRWTLTIDPASGTISRIAFVDRGPEGDWGTVEHILSDYRRAGGLDWPHRRVVTFNGEVVPYWGTRTASLETNVELDAALFERPAELR
jgi:YHS domain-containing protein